VFFPVADHKKHTDNLLMVALGAQGSWFCACGFFWSKRSARVRRYDKPGKRDLTDDRASTQNIETSFVSSNGMLSGKKCSELGRRV
jgi:hypothetical protein